MTEDEPRRRALGFWSLGLSALQRREESGQDDLGLGASVNTSHSGKAGASVSASHSLNGERSNGKALHVRRLARAS